MYPRHQKPLRGVQLNRTHPLSRGLIGCWLFNEGTGQRIYDACGNWKDGSATAMDQTNWVNGPYGSALTFDGSAEYIIAGNAYNLGGVSSSVIALFRWTSADYKCIFSNGRDYDTYWQFLIFGGHISYRHDSGNFVEGTIGLTSGVWYHGAMTISWPTLSLYTNSRYDNGGTLTNTNSIGNSQIGARYEGGYSHVFNGAIAGIWLYNRALNSVEVARHYANPYCMFEEADARSKIWAAGGATVEFSGSISAQSSTQNIDFNLQRSLSGTISFQSSTINIDYQVLRLFTAAISHLSQTTAIDFELLRLLIGSISFQSALTSIDYDVSRFLSAIIAYQSLSSEIDLETGAVAIDQEGFRWRNDDGTEVTATWRQNQDIDDSIQAGQNIRLRFVLNASGNPDSKQFTLQYKKTSESESDWKTMPVA